jgi:hypothetical protein
VTACPDGPGGGYSDISDGAQVAVADSTGKTLALGELSGGTYGPDGIVFSFHVDDVPDADIYSIEVTHRGAVKFSRKQLESDDWTVGLKIG